MTLQEPLRAAAITPVLIDSTDQGLRMVSAGRLDVLLVEHLTGSEAAEAIGGASFKVRRDMHEDTLYHVLNRKRASLAPALADAFTDMRRDGSLARLSGKYAVLMVKP